MSGWADFTQLVLPYPATDLVFQDITHKLAPSQVFSPAYNYSYDGLIVATTQATAATITCLLTDTNGVSPQWQGSMPAQGANLATVFYIPIPIVVGSAPKITLTSSVNQAAAGTTDIIGVTRMPPGVAPSRVVPVGGANIVAGGGGQGSTFTFVNAPPAGFAYRLHAFWAEEPPATGNALLTAAGTTRPFYGEVSGQSPYSLLGGQLASTSVAVFNNMGANCTFDLSYDIVSVFAFS